MSFKARNELGNEDWITKIIARKWEGVVAVVLRELN